MKKNYQVKAKLYRFWFAPFALWVFASVGIAQEPIPPLVAEAQIRQGPDANIQTEKSSVLTLSDALSLALQQSPMLAVFNWDIRAADAMIDQAGLRPNPELSVEIEGVRWSPGPSERTRTTSISGPLSSPWEEEKIQGANSGFSEAELTISIAQLIELGRKRAKRIVVAEREKELVLWDYQAARADVLAQTASHFTQVFSAQEHVALEQDLVALAKDIVRTFALRVGAGQVSPLDLSRAEVALATTKINYEESIRELESARVVLASNWGSTLASFDHVVGRLDVTQPVPAIEEMEARVNQNPDLARWSSELAMRRAEFSLERAQRIPDLTVELGFRSASLSDRTARQY